MLQKIFNLVFLKSNYRGNNGGHINSRVYIFYVINDLSPRNGVRRSKFESSAGDADG